MSTLNTNDYAYLWSPTRQILDKNGKPLVSGYVQLNQHGTPGIYAQSYSDWNGSLNARDILLDGLGRASAIVENDKLYDMYVYNRYNVLEYSALGVNCSGEGGDSPMRFTSSDGSIIITRLNNSVDLKVYSEESAYGTGTGSSVDNQGFIQFENVDGNITLISADTLSLTASKVYHVTLQLEISTTTLTDSYIDATVNDSENGVHKFQLDGSKTHQYVDISWDLYATKDYAKFYANLPSSVSVTAATLYIHAVNSLTVGGGGGGVQSNWDESDPDSLAYIQNKPDLSIYAESSDLSSVAFSGDYDDLSNKPSIPAAQVNSDWNANSGVAEILNKPANLVQDANYVHTDNNFTTALKDKLNGIEAGAEVNVNADWNANSGDAQILNKPNLATVATSGSYNDLSNKPDIRNVPDVTSSNDGMILKATYSGGVGSYAWGTYTDIDNIEIVDVSDIATRFGTYANLISEITSGKYFVLKRLNAGQTYFFALIGFTNSVATFGHSTGDNRLENNVLARVNDLLNISYQTFNTRAFQPTEWVNYNYNYYLQPREYTTNEYITVYKNVAEVESPVIIYKCILGYTETGSTNTPENDTTHWQRVYLIDVINEINSSIPAAQVNSDWNANSGVAQILNKPNLATVATSGSYNDLTDKPVIPSIPVVDVEVDGTSVVNGNGVAEIDLTPYAKSSELATVATSGSYNDLSNKPSIPAAQVQSDYAQSNTTAVDYIKNKPDLSVYALSSSLATVATSGSYNDLSNKPTIPAAQVNADWNSSSGVSEILNKPNLATVATSGSYNDLSNKPTIPAAQVQSDYAQTDSTAVDYIKNKPTLFSGDYNDLTNKPDLSIYAESSDLATVATTGSYNDLSNKPTIPAAQVQSDYTQSDTSAVDYIKNKPDLSVYALSSSLATVATSGDYDDLTNKPTIPAAQVNSDWNASSGVAQILNKPTLSTVATTGDYDDLTDKPDLSIYAESSSLATVATSGSYNDLSNKPTIPAAQVNSDWNASSGVAEILNKPNLATVATSGDYNDLSNTPTIPDGVPAVTSTDDGKVLTASYSGGEGSYGWVLPSDLNNIEIVDVTDISTRFSTFADLAAEINAGKVFVFKEYRYLTTNPYDYYIISRLENNILYCTCTRSLVNSTSLLSEINASTLVISSNLTYNVNRYNTNLFKYLEWIDDTRVQYIPVGVHAINEYLMVSGDPGVLSIYKCISGYTQESGSNVKPSNDTTHWQRVYLNDILNDIQSSIPAAQVNSDWNASSGVAEILNKPNLSVYALSSSLATVATSGDYDDLTNKPTIPAAQVNSDWNSSSGVSQILNKPSIPVIGTITV